MKIVYFDGYCNVCNRYVDFLIRRDHARKLKFASLQGVTAQKRLPAQYTSSVNTMVYQDGESVWDQSSAALRATAELGGCYLGLKLFLFFPQALRDLVYRAIAKRRYKLFGKREVCRMPTKEEQAQFLD